MFEDNTSAASHLCDFLKKVYPMDDPRFVHQIDRGLTTDNVLIADGSQYYFVKIHHPKRDLGRIKEVLKAEQFLGSAGIPTISPVKLSNGDMLAGYSDRWLTVYPRIENKEFDSLPPHEAIVSLAQTLAQLHKIGLHKTDLTSKKIEGWDTQSFLDKSQKMLSLISASEDNADFDNIAREFVETKMKLAKTCPMSYSDLGFVEDTLCHGDYHYHNVFFDEQNKVSHVFDFERILQSSRFTELALAMFFICFDINTPVLDEVSEIHYQRSQAFLKTYHEAYPFNKEDLEKGIHWFYWSQMVHSLWPLEKHYQENSTRADAWVAKRLNRLNYVTENFQPMMERLLAFQ